MLYTALLYGDETDGPEPGTPAFDEELARYYAFDEANGDHIRGGAALHSVGEAATVRPSVDGPLVTAGPFAETSEVVGGLYMLEAAGLDEAIELARQIPPAETGAVELRPMVEWHPQLSTAADRPGEQYVAFILAVESAAEEPGTPEWEAGAAEHKRFIEGAGDVLLSGAALRPAATATVVRVRDGELLFTDGPFSETKEVIGGLYIIAAADREAAAEIAARIPIGASGAVELRRVMEFDS